MNDHFDHCESLYWVFTQLCNDSCDHCYNESGPRGTRMTLEDCLRIVDNLPSRIDHLILSGGEPLADRKKLYAILDRLGARYLGSGTRLMLQTNGDLLNAERLDTLLEKGVTRFDIASIDRYHRHRGARLDALARLFESRGVQGDDREPLVGEAARRHGQTLSWGAWGATEDMWLGGNWARGRALEKDIWKRDPEHNFCAIHSGARNFLGGHDDIVQEISIQLWKINPCCPGTRYPIGDARVEAVADALRRAARSPVFRALNDGQPWKMGLHLGISEEEARARTRELENICLYCDAFFGEHMQALNRSSFRELPVVRQP